MPQPLYHHRIILHLHHLSAASFHLKERPSHSAATSASLILHAPRKLKPLPNAARCCSLLSSLSRFQSSNLPASKVVVANEEQPNSQPPLPSSVEAISSKIYDATVIGEPMALGKDKSKVWEKIMNARIVYLGEAKQVPIKDDKELELEIVKNLKKRCLETEKSISIAMEAFPRDL